MLQMIRISRFHLPDTQQEEKDAIRQTTFGRGARLRKRVKGRALVKGGPLARFIERCSMRARTGVVNVQSAKARLRTDACWTPGIADNRT